MDLYIWISSQEEVREVIDVSEMIPPPPESVKEMKVQAQRDLEESVSLLVANTPELGIAHIINCEECSDFSKLCRVTAYFIRFVNKIKARSSKAVSPVGSGSFTSELLFSESLWILESQKSLLRNRNFKQSALLRVIRGMHGILRCKGRLVSVNNESLPRTKWRMGVVHELIKRVDKKTRGTDVCITDKGKSSYLRRPLQRLCPPEILANVKKEPESFTEDVTSEKEGIPEPDQAELTEMPLLPRRQAARAGEERRRLLTNC